MGKYNYSVRVNITLPQTMMTRLDDMALKALRSRSSFIQEILLKTIEEEQQAEASRRGVATWKTSYDPDLENFMIEQGIPVPDSLHRPQPLP